jgi:hypothetical protein
MQSQAILAGTCVWLSPLYMYRKTCALGAVKVGVGGTDQRGKACESQRKVLHLMDLEEDCYTSIKCGVWN